MLWLNQMVLTTRSIQSEQRCRVFSQSGADQNQGGVFPAFTIGRFEL